MRRAKGVISVYLAIVFPILVSLITTSVKSAVSRIEYVYAEQLVNTGVKSALGRFYRPLFDEYGMFLLWNRENPDNASELILEETRCSVDASLTTKGDYSSFNLTEDDIVISDLVSPFDYGGEPVRNQAVKAAKYDAASSGAKILLDKFGLLAGEGETSIILEEKMEIEEGLSEIDRILLKLMKTIDGICFADGAVEVDKTGNIVTEDYFLKLYQNGTVTPESVGINNSRLFDALLPKYRNPVVEAELLVEAGKQYLSIKRNLDSVQLLLDVLREKKAEELQQLEEMEEGDCSEEEILLQKELISETEKKIEEAEQEEFDLTAALYDASVAAETGYERFADGILMVSVKNKAAVELIDSVYEIGNSFRDRVVEFGNMLDEAAGVISDENLQMLSESFEDMKRYTGLDENPGENRFGEYNLSAIRETVLYNSSIFSELSGYSVKPYPADTTSFAEEAWQNSIIKAEECLCRLSFDNLVFDYSGLQFEKRKNTLFDSIEELFASDFYSLLIPDYDNASDGKILSDRLPSTWSGGKTSERSSNPADGLEDKSGSELLAAASDNSGINGLSAFLSESGEALINNILYLTYIGENFNSYLSETKRQDRPLAYEIEYLICGNESDRENLEDTAFRILMVRTLINVGHVMMDSSKRAEAEAFAVSVAGFTGLPFLIAVVKYVVLFVWALEQSAVETMAILMGKEVAAITSKDTFCITFPELLLASPSFFKEKAENLKKGSINLSYGDYLYAFLILTSRENQNFRLMDLIQSHIRYEYETEFYFVDCVYGFTGELTLSGSGGQISASASAGYH